MDEKEKWSQSISDNQIPSKNRALFLIENWLVVITL